MKISNSFKFLLIILNTVYSDLKIHKVDTTSTKIWGPGLQPDLVILPARYFFIHAANSDGIFYNVSLPKPYEIKLVGKSQYGICRSIINQIDRGDGSIIVRYKLIHVCNNVQIHIKYDNEHLADSPYHVKGFIYTDSCICPQSMENMLNNFECPVKLDKQIQSDLIPFQKVNFTNIRQKIIRKYNSPGSVSMCNYIVKNNVIYRKCYGQYTGFKMFIDAILSSITRKVKLPDLEFFANLGDWPLIKKGGQSRTTGPYPMFSWCGSDDTFDIVLPSYDITESTLENMGRVTLDLLSVQKIDTLWHDKIEKGFWRGRDSRRERLNLIDVARENADLINASLTNFFFFKDEESKYGPKAPHISFFDFFHYKYQINIDGTVAAYRLPYLLAGNSVVFKQESTYYEHFYKKLFPNKHFIPFKRDLSNLVEQIKWAKENDRLAHEIMLNARKFAEENLLPTHIFCYHVQLFKEWSSRIVSNIQILHDMEKVEPKNTDCVCPTESPLLTMKDEL